MQHQQQLHIIKLPTLTGGLDDPFNQTLVHRYRDLRLLALRTDPRAFASSHELELQRSDEAWLQRLSNSHAVHFVAVECRESSSSSAAAIDVSLESPWQGVIVLLGPEFGAQTAVSGAVDPFRRMTAAISSTHDHGHDDERTSRQAGFHLNGVFARMEARGRGVGGLLVQAALQEAKNRAVTEGTRQWSCSVLVDSENGRAAKVYEQAGFVRVGEEDYVQQPRALVEGEEETSRRTAIRLEYVPPLKND